MKNIQIILLTTFVFFSSPIARAESNPAVDPIEEQQASSPESAPASPKQGWKDYPQDGGDEDSILTDILLWVPNRLLDFWDIFRLDVGVGASMGGVIRVSEYAQAGFRAVPLSVRAGNLGRRVPVMLETSGEMGVSPAFKESGDREICPGEVGAGVDLFVVGGYTGVCVDEVADFLAGLFFIDLKDDDF